MKLVRTVARRNTDDRTVSELIRLRDSLDRLGLLWTPFDLLDKYQSIELARNLHVSTLGGGGSRGRRMVRGIQAVGHDCNMTRVRACSVTFIVGSASFLVWHSLTHANTLFALTTHPLNNYRRTIVYAAQSGTSAGAGRPGRHDIQQANTCNEVLRPAQGCSAAK